MASVNLTIPEEAIALTPDHKSYLVHRQSSNRFCKPNAKDVFYVTSIMLCAVTILLLYFKICIMEQNMTIDNLNLVSSVDSTSDADELPHVKDETEESKRNATAKDKSLSKLLRARRQTGSNGYYPNEQAWNNDGTFTDSMPSNHDNSHPSIHVTGITSNAVGNGDWFMWHSDSEPSYGGISHTTLPFIQHKYVEIQQPGYYFIYSQLTYRDTNDYAIGHEIVRKANCGAGADERLLNSIRTQVETKYLESGEALYPEDSGYVGGVFYLSANDRVGVRPLSTVGGQEVRLFAQSSVGSYFGMFMLHRDHTAPIANGPCRG